MIESKCVKNIFAIYISYIINDHQYKNVLLRISTSVPHILSLMFKCIKPASIHAFINEFTIRSVQFS